MSKSYGNAIFISDESDDIRSKVMTFITDPARKLKTDPGNPDICPLQQLHKPIAPDAEISQWDRCCRAAECGCVAHKRALADQLIEYLAGFRARRAQLAQNPTFAREVLEAGALRARPIAAEVIATVRELLGMEERSPLSAGIVTVDNECAQA